MSTTYFSVYTGLHRQRRRRPVYVSLGVLLAAAVAR